MAARFSNIDPATFIRDNENQNTLKKTLSHVKLLQGFIQAKYNVVMPIHLLPPHELNKYIADFIINVRKSDGGEYEPSYLRGFVSSFDRQLKRHKYTLQIMSNCTEFQESRDALRSKQRDLKAQGKGSKPNKADPLTDEEINHLYECNELGIKTPSSLINTLWFLNTLHFGIRGGSEEHRNIHWGDIQLKHDPANRTDYLEYHERATKTRTGEDLRNTRVCPPRAYATPSDRERCPVHTYMVYQSKRPEGYSNPDDPFYLAVVTNNKNPSVSEKWFLKGPIGKNKIEHLMRTMATNANLPENKRITNTSVRKTLVQKMTDSNVPDSLQVYVTGHKNPSSLNNYRTLNESHKLAISHILSNTAVDQDTRCVTFGSNHQSTATLATACTERSTSSQVQCFRSTQQLQQTSSSTANRTVHASSPRQMIESLFSGNTIQNCTFNFNMNSFQSQNQ